MGKIIGFTLLCAAFSVAFLSIYHGEARADRETELGRIRFLSCHGETFQDGSYTQAEILDGAYNAWCYDASGTRVAKIHHGPALQVSQSASGHILVDWTHYKDKNHDGELEEDEADGFISVDFDVTPQSIDRVVPSHSGQQVTVALEIEGPQILSASGWFKGTEQVINRTNVKVEPAFNQNGEPIGGRVVYSNWSVLSFLKNPAVLDL